MLIRCVNRDSFGYPTHGEVPDNWELTMIIVGLILLLIGLLASSAILWTIGVVLLAIGAVLWLLGAAGRPLAGRRHYW